MHKVWIIFKREYLTRVRTKAFILATVLIPILSAGLFGFSIYMATRQNNRTMKIGIIDNAGGLADAITKGLDNKLPNGLPAFQVVKTIDRPASGEPARKEMLDQVNAGTLDGYLVLPKDADKANTAEFHTRNTGDFSLEGAIQTAVSNTIITMRLSNRGIHVDKLDDVIHRVNIKMIKVSGTGEIEEKGQTFVTAMVLALLLYATLIMYGIVTMRSVLEEKTTRIVEILISAVTPFQLLAGKIIGVAAVACTQYAIWITAGLLLSTYGSAMAATYSPGASISDFHIPAIVFAALLIYFLLGYFLYASLYAAIGSAASNEQDAQQMQMPATIPIVMSFMLFNVVLRDANSLASVVLSEIPFFSPILMLLRISVQMPPLWQIALSITLLILTTLCVIYFSARIYRVGVLMYGKRPSLVEMLRWLRYS
ncbi:MAG TPA: ABC transporter permease [Terriglobia bacterium]|nr:ABC transporter permease [Terriglobia bacterium]